MQIVLKCGIFSIENIMNTEIRIPGKEEPFSQERLEEICTRLINDLQAALLGTPEFINAVAEMFFTPQLKLVKDVIYFKKDGFTYSISFNKDQERKDLFFSASSSADPENPESINLTIINSEEQRFRNWTQVSYFKPNDQSHPGGYHNTPSAVAKIEESLQKLRR